MNLQNLKYFRKLLVENDQQVSELEYTKNNYDHEGNLIKKDIPTFTTEFCEIGLFNKVIYFVFIVESKTFELDTFNELKNESNMTIYGFFDFKKTLYPVGNFGWAVKTG